MELRRMVVPLDGSERATAVLPYVQVFAEAAAAQVYLLGVLDPAHPEWAGCELGPSAGQELYRRLSAAAEDLRARGIAVEILLRPGKPAEIITGVADELEADMLALATRGRGGLTRLLLGSVADGVVKRSRTAVLLVSPPDAAQDTPSLTLRRVLVPLDGSPLAEQVLPLAGNVARLLDAELILARVESFAPVWPHGAPPDLDGGLEQLMARAAQDYLEQVQRRLPADVVSSLVVLRGTPNGTLVAFVDRNDIGLVVMATHGRSGVQRLVLGSVADALLRSGTPTLLLPPAAARITRTPVAVGGEAREGAASGPATEPHAQPPVLHSEVEGW